MAQELDRTYRDRALEVEEAQLARLAVSSPDFHPLTLCVWAPLLSVLVQGQTPSRLGRLEKVGAVSPRTLAALAAVAAGARGAQPSA